MLTPVTCLTCGYPLDLAVVYQMLRRAREGERQEGGTLPQFATEDPSSRGGKTMEDVLKALRIDYPCCRTRITTVMLFGDHY